MPRARPPGTPPAVLTPGRPTTPGASSSPPPTPATASKANSGTQTTSTILNHTFAPFYACYLLKSYHPKRLNQTYIGSTPDPPRRWRQHMGETVGGAFKTRLARPWEMEAIVYGFPTKLQALQFEWAWQNPHASRLLHAIPAASDTAVAPPSDPSEAESSTADTAQVAGKHKKRKEPKKKLSKKVKPDKPPKPTAQFPRTAASGRGQTRVQVLQYMLTVPPWRSFNLSVMLFSDLAHEWWDRARRGGPVVRTDAGWNKFERLAAKEREQGIATEDPWGERARWLDQIRVDVRRDGVDGERLVRIGEKDQADAIDRMRIDDDDFFHQQWSKWTELVSGRSCHLCNESVDDADHVSFFLCTSASDGSSSSSTGQPTTPCTALFHPTCLSRHFLASSVPSPASAPPAPSTAAPAAVLSAPLLPTHGHCPACRAELHWTDLVRSSYRRAEEVEGKRKKRTKQRATKAAAAVGSQADIELEDDAESGETGRVGATKTPQRRTKKRDAAPALTRGRRKVSKTASATRALSSVANASDEGALGETFDFLSDLDEGAEVEDDDDGADSSDDLERSFARLEAAQDALAAAPDPAYLRHDLDDVTTTHADLFADYHHDLSEVSSLESEPSPPKHGRKATATYSAGRTRQAASSAASSLTTAFKATKPSRSRTAASSAAKPAPRSARDADLDDLAALGTVGRPRKLAESAPAKPEQAAYIEISD
ncbi:hypothetical protein JCM8202_001774 [Rhodotorula sphaerocarpa]